MVKPWKTNVDAAVAEDGACGSGISDVQAGASDHENSSSNSEGVTKVVNDSEDVPDEAAFNYTEFVLPHEWQEQQFRMRSRSQDIEKGTISLIELMVQTPEDVICSQDKDGDNELMIAIIKRNIEYALFIIDILVSRKKNKLLDLRNCLGQSALHLAVKTNLPPVTEALVRAGMTLDLRDKNGHTPLHCASDKGLFHHVKILTSIGDKPSNKKIAELYDYQGWNCIHLATRNCSTSVIDYLIAQYGVDINLRGGSRGMTALHFAIMVQDITMVLFLVHVAKADLRVKTYDNWTPLEFATGFKHDLLVKLLIKAGADAQEHYNFRKKLAMLDGAVSLSEDD